MKQYVRIAALAAFGLLAALPAGAQDDGGFGGGLGGFDGGLGGGGFGGGRGGGGGQQTQQQQQQRVATVLLQSNPADNLITMLKSALERNGGPKLSKDQEKDMTAFFTKQAKTSLAEIEAKAKQEGLNLPNAAQAGPPLGKSAQEIVQLYFELNTGRGNNANNGNRGGNNNAGNRGNRGGNNNGNNNNRLNALVLRPAEDAFFVALADAPPLNAKQKTAVLKWRNEVIRARGGVDEFRIQMEEGGAPLTADQVTQLKTVFDESDQKRTTLRNDLLQRAQDLQTPPEGPRETGGATTQNQNQNQNNNALTQLQGLGKVDDAKVLALSTDMKQKADAMDKETNTKILRALTDQQRPVFVNIELKRQEQRREQIKQQLQQVLQRR